MRAWMSLKFGQIRLLVSVETDRVIMARSCCHFFLGCFYPILFILAGNDDMHESSEEFEIRPDTTTELAALERLKKSTQLHGEKWCCHIFTAVLDRTHFILACNTDIHESLDEFEIWPNPTTGFHGKR